MGLVSSYVPTETRDSGTDEEGERRFCWRSRCASERMSCNGSTRDAATSTTVFDIRHRDSFELSFQRLLQHAGVLRTGSCAMDTGALASCDLSKCLCHVSTYRSSLCVHAIACSC